MKNKIIKHLSIASIIASTLLIMIIGTLHLMPPTPDKLFKTSMQSIAELKAVSEKFGESYGTAVCIKSEGYLVTNAHVVTYKQLGEALSFDEYFIRLSTEEEYHTVDLIKYDLENDLAILKVRDININLKSIKLGNSDSLDFGDKVYAIGNGSNYGLAITHGMISIPKINIEYDGITREVIQSDITISAGNSGGALLDRDGKLIGITTFRTKDNNGNVIYGLVYSVPINEVLHYLEN